MRILLTLSGLLAMLPLNSLLVSAAPPDNQDSQQPSSAVQHDSAPEPVAGTYVKVDDRRHTPLYARIREDGSVEISHRKPAHQPIDSHPPSIQK